MARDFSEVMTETMNTIAPGLKKIGPDIGDELKRLHSLGATELANALFSGSAFTLYGPNNEQPTRETDKGGLEHGVHGATSEPEQERGGREM